jgi:hypothetical protein
MSPFNAGDQLNRVSAADRDRAQWIAIEVFKFSIRADGARIESK